MLPDRRPVAAAFDGIAHRFIGRDVDDLDDAYASTVHSGRAGTL
ncbi:hypothetical protein [Methylobacterium nigriterrae]